ncbi:hypothetical protein GPL21_33380 [Bradyrhizobium pachyrhizi]|uniref:Uncharacterized protein n=1 Tax=Bradyrhizobium pachyrhizi TaxID=280333 RepID=A0A844SSL9_9BRAD|nr:hypothetical protein [Bradyrhizobium pachyrhizi]MVT69978.1 hypothetical protein [Bradyrhizobium pachyrhizi]
MIRNFTQATDCGRDFDTVSTRYQKRVRNLKNRLRTPFWYRYQNRVRSPSYSITRTDCSRRTEVQCSDGRSAEAAGLDPNGSITGKPSEGRRAFSASGPPSNKVPDNDEQQAADFNNVDTDDMPVDLQRD